ncbi:MAG: DeoR family transcriptional regulator [Spirochaetes bacterium]|jgi:DeoR/GlpR family transcriptional regulator of sugar metabolism|nr:DeoR family transcriptional regulator [Spirochaetota bacterium]
MRNPRHDDILRILQARKRISVGELTSRLSVSEVTIRKDLALLEDMGLLTRTHGGAALAEDREHRRALVVRRRENVEGKALIARAAAELVEEGETVYIDAGSTCALLAENLADRTLRVVTNSIDAVATLADAPSVALFSVGGSYRKEAGSFIGPLAVAALEGMHISTAFLGTSGFTADGVFSSQNTIESELKKQVIRRAGRTVLVVDRTKFGRTAFAVFACADEVDLVVTDTAAGEIPELDDLGVEVLHAREPSAPGRHRHKEARE